MAALYFWRSSFGNGLATVFLERSRFSWTGSCFRCRRSFCMGGERIVLGLESASHWIDEWSAFVSFRKAHPWLSRRRSWNERNKKRSKLQLLCDGCRVGQG